MSRDDGMLYSGATSAAFGTSRTHLVREEKSKAKQESREKLTPAAEVINSAIRIERNKVVEQIANMVIDLKTGDKEVARRVLAHQDNLRFIDNFQITMNNALRKAGK